MTDFESGLGYCPCPKESCERHGKCQECIENHARKGKLPFCKR